MPWFAGRIHLAIVLSGLTIGCGDSADHTSDTPAESKLDTRWQCPAEGEQAQGSTVNYGFKVVDFATHMPVHELRANACRTSDLKCEDPVDTFVDSDDSGSVELELPNGFVGYVEVTSDAVDTLLYVTNPLVKNTVDRDLTVPTVDTVDFVATVLDYEQDTDKGVAVLEVLDCDEIPRGGVHFDSRDSEDGFYMIDQTPDKAAQSTVFDSASNTAEGGFLNVPPGIAQFSVKDGDDTLGTFDAQIRKGALTVVVLHH